MLKAFTIIVVLALVSGCSEPATPDTNTHVFQTVDQVAAARKAQQQKNWKQTALEVIHDERLDISASAPSEGLSITLSADGAQQRIDLEELSPALTAQP